jgi:hypothetical protein
MSQSESGSSFVQAVGAGRVCKMSKDKSTDVLERFFRKIVHFNEQV